jgi:hypothetical protein
MASESPRKNQGHVYMPYTIEMGETSRPYNTLEWQILEVVDTHRILVVILDRQLTWRLHIETVKVKCRKRLNFLTHLAGTQ